MITRIFFVGSGSTVYYCVQYLPVSTVVTILNLGPIFIFFIEAFAEKVQLIAYVEMRQFCKSRSDHV